MNCNNCNDKFKCDFYMSEYPGSGDLYKTKKLCDELVKKENYRILINENEFQQKVLDYINSGEIDEMINSTVFKDKPECKSAIIHGMSIASMLTHSCEPYCIIENDKKSNI